MKKIIVFIFLFAAVTLSAQDIPADDTTAKPAITEIGKPDGEKSEMEIGKDGGSFTSSDGKVKLIIPEGAVSKKTTFSIQPVTNLMQNGNGKAYRLEPSAMQFQKPVQLVFHYDPEESEDSMQLLMGIAMQDDKGQWYGLNEFTLDTVAKTISGNINHFSIWSTYDKLKLRTFFGKGRLKVKGSEGLGIWGVFADQDDKDSRGLSKLKTMKPPQNAIWYVEGAIKGNEYVGTLEKGRVDESDARWNTYTAPANVPDDNPVTISVELVWESYISNGRIVKYRELKTKILIYDNAYEVKMTSYIDRSALTRLGSSTYKDSGSFVVSLNGKETKIIEKLNKNTNDGFDYEPPGCTCKTLKTGSGFINMVGVPDITVTPATASQPARVKIQFKRTPVIFPVVKVTCKGGKGQRPFTVTYNELTAIFAMMFAYPHSIEFTAKEGEEEWEIFETAYNIPEGTPLQTEGRTYLKYIVRKLKDNEW